MVRHVDEYDVRLMAEGLEVSPSGYYVWRQRPPSERAIADARLLLTLRIAHAKSDGDDGAPRVQRALKDDGLHVGTKRVARLMRIAARHTRVPSTGSCSTSTRCAHG